MSKRINVNPDHYKVAGRERQGEDIVHREQRQTYASTNPGKNEKRNQGGGRRRGRSKP
jgi:hypothetical protein